MSTHTPFQQHARRLSSLWLIPLLALSAIPVDAAVDVAKAGDDKASGQLQLDQAQRRLEQAAREVADLSMSLSDHELPTLMPSISIERPSAVLGVNIGSRRGEEPADGVEVLSVSPGGAAAEAGLQAGDVLTELNGKPLKREGAFSPRSRLLVVMRDVSPGDKVAVRYRRAGKMLSANVVAQAPADRVFASAGVAGRLPGMPFVSFMRSEGVFGSAEMVSLTPQLGRYFGTDKGLLVVRAPGDDRLKLEEGDVIIDIDGRVPESAAHASRILGSYEAGEKLHLNVLRMKQKVMLDVEVPADARGRTIERRLERSSFGPGVEPDVTLAVPMTMPAPAGLSVLMLRGEPPAAGTLTRGTLLRATSPGDGER